MSPRNINNTRCMSQSSMITSSSGPNEPPQMSTALLPFSMKSYPKHCCGGMQNELMGIDLVCMGGELMVE